MPTPLFHTTQPLLSALPHIAFIPPLKQCMYTQTHFCLRTNSPSFPLLTFLPLQLFVPPLPSLSLSLSLSLASLFYSFCPSLPPSFSPSLSLAVDNVQLLDETIQHNLLLGMRPKSTPHHQKFDPGKVSRSVSLSTIHVRVHHLGHQTVVPHVDVGRPRCVPLHL